MRSAQTVLIEAIDAARQTIDLIDSGLGPNTAGRGSRVAGGRRWYSFLTDAFSQHGIEQAMAGHWGGDQLDKARRACVELGELVAELERTQRPPDERSGAEAAAARPALDRLLTTVSAADIDGWADELGSVAVSDPRACALVGRLRQVETALSTARVQLVTG